jgi:hypothetical protein
VHSIGVGSDFICFVTFSIDILNNTLFQQKIHSIENTWDETLGSETMRPASRFIW